jgi:hypothetical protein
MGESFLRIQVAVDLHDYDTVGVSVEARSEFFGGKTEQIYTSPDEIRRFAATIAVYPLPVEPVVLDIGHRQPDGIGTRAQLSVSAELNSVRIDVVLEEYGGKAHYLKREINHVCGTTLFAEYESVRRFSQQLMSVLRGDLSDAFLLTYTNYP